MDENKCGFCHTGDETVDICGTLHKDTMDGKVIAAHHKCMQYSACLVQYKSDSFGGFKKHQVYDEIRRGSRLICTLCKNDKKKKNKKGATSGCALKNCRKTFHYYCVSMNPDAVAKRYRVAAGQKVVILYRVFCSQKHEELYRINLKAEDVIGGQEDSSSDSEQEDNESHENQSRSSYNTDTDVEPAYKRAKTDLKEDTDVVDEGIEQGKDAASPMSVSEVHHQVQMEYSALLEKHIISKSKSTDGGHRNGAARAEEELGMVTDVSSHSESEGSAAGRSDLSKGLYVVIPSKFDKTDLNSICLRVETPMENCVLWPPSNDRKGLQEKHLPYVMWDIANKIRRHELSSLVSTIMEPCVSHYECMCNFHHQSPKDENIFKRLFQCSSEANCEYKMEVCRLLNVTDDSGKLLVLIVFLPKSFVQLLEMPLFFHLYPWTSSTVANFSDQQPTIATCEAEKKTLVKVLKHKLKGQKVTLLSYPQDSVLEDCTIPSIARSIEFKIETMALGMGGPVRVMVVRNVDRSVVQYKAYLHKLLQLFMHEGMRSASYCVLSISPVDGIRTLSDILPNDCLNSAIQVYSAFDPQINPVSCLLLYVPEKKKHSEADEENPGIRDVGSSYESQASVYLDNAESQGASNGVFQYAGRRLRPKP